MSGSEPLGYRAIIEAMLDSVIVLGLDGTITAINPATEQLTGYSAEELIGQTIALLFADEKSALRTTRLERPRKGAPLRKEEVDYRSKSGVVIPVSVIGAPILVEGRLTGLVLVARDLRETRRLLAEVQAGKAELETKLEIARSSLLRAERLATLGTLAAGVGHELANIGTILSSCVHSFAEGTSLAADEIEALRHVDQHVREHAERLLNLATPGPDEAGEFDLGELVSDTVEMVRRSGRAKYIAFEVSCDGEYVAFANPTRIEQVLVNLLFNAADSIADDSGDGAITVSVSTQNGRAVVRVRDNGCGIETHRLKEVFAAFHTTKPAGEGTGLGLMVARQIVENYAGTLRVESTHGVGATFLFDLPLA